MCQPHITVHWLFTEKLGGGQEISASLNAGGSHQVSQFEVSDDSKAFERLSEAAEYNRDSQLEVEHQS